MSKYTFYIKHTTGEVVYCNMAESYSKALMMMFQANRNIEILDYDHEEE